MQTAAFDAEVHHAFHRPAAAGQVVHQAVTRFPAALARPVNDIEQASAPPFGEPRCCSTSARL